MYIRHGGLKFFYKGGSIFVKITEHQPNDGVIAFLGQKCGVCIPALSTDEQTMIWRSGLLGTLFRFSLLLFGFDLFFSILILWDGNSRSQMLDQFRYFQFLELVKSHIGFDAGVLVLLLGIWVTLVNILPMQKRRRTLDFFSFVCT